MLQRLDHADVVPQLWRNGAGSTLELACDTATPWRWRLSVAQLERDAPFSAWPGVQRLFTPLDRPLRLHFPEQPPRLVARLQVIAFDGAACPHCTLPEGSGRALNLMLRGGLQGRLIARPLQGTMYLPLETDSQWLLYAAAGSVIASDDDVRLSLQAGEAARIAGCQGRLLLDGAGDLVLAQLPIA